MSKIEQQIFKSGSRTYYLSSLFFPRKARDDIFRLYSFVRVADDYVDQLPPKADELHKLRELWQKLIADESLDTTTYLDDPINLRVVKNIVHVTRKYRFEHSWIESFFDSMQMDLDRRSYQSLDELLQYIYGSAEVIGLMMSRIMDLPKELDEAACLQGRAMQYINFIRDISEDNKLKRLYFPSEDLARYGLPNLQHGSAQAHSDEFKSFIQLQLQRYIEWQYKADIAYSQIPRRYRVPLRTAAAMYGWTAAQIKADPFVVYRKKVRPSRSRIITTALRKIVQIS